MSAAIGLVDYGMGNRRSVEKALEHVGARVVRSGDPEVLRGAAKLILPGVGAFPEAMRRLRASGLDALLRERVAAGVPLLGICLGMQLLFESSEEHEGDAGLGLLRGHVRRIAPVGERVPHIGWNVVREAAPSILLDGDEAYYHVHSLAPFATDSAVGLTEYGGQQLATVVQQGGVMGTQFHPEKSSTAGLALLRSFVTA